MASDTARGGGRGRTRLPQDEFVHSYSLYDRMVGIFSLILEREREPARVARLINGEYVIIITVRNYCTKNEAHRRKKKYIELLCLGARLHNSSRTAFCLFSTPFPCQEVDVGGIRTCTYVVLSPSLTPPERSSMARADAASTPLSPPEPRLPWYAFRCSLLWPNAVTRLAAEDTADMTP